MDFCLKNMDTKCYASHFFAVCGLPYRLNLLSTHQHECQSCTARQGAQATCAKTIAMMFRLHKNSDFVNVVVFILRQLFQNNMEKKAIYCLAYGTVIYRNISYCNPCIMICIALPHSCRCTALFVLLDWSMLSTENNVIVSFCRWK